MKRNSWSRRVFVAAVSVMAVVGVAACSESRGGNGNGGNGGGVAGGDGATPIRADDVEQQLDSFPVAELTDEEIAALVWMREEEKLAHDVYSALGAIYDVQVFDNIAAAEQTHTEAVLALLARYGIADPAEGLGVGEFTDPTLQALYDQLVAVGSASMDAAFRVGAEIEELDIVDLQDRATTTPDIQFVFGNLERGSRNHLRAFTKQLERSGETYVPTHLGQAEYDAIVAGGMEQGNP
ncbi:MAG TPA: ferritin [Acidimicrobiaceae bacterium]|nr:ferritin [Acidimicrobiaceae bacterium]